MRLKSIHTHSDKICRWALDPADRSRQGVVDQTHHQSREERNDNQCVH